jgi:sulfatase maturation enzyme AslB (radical SAM superfamily)
MSLEWVSPWNSFNSMKILRWWKHLENASRENYLTPISVDIDPSSLCQLNCSFCNAHDIIDNKESLIPNGLLSESHLIKLADFLRDWGKDTEERNPKSVCIGGGGSPLVNPATMSLIERLSQNKIESGLITNGILLTKEKIDIIAKNCRWCGISVDAGLSDTYNKIKGLPEISTLFRKVLENIKLLSKRVNELGTKCDVAFKFLLCPDNADEIYQACKIAKELGVNDFHCRPVGYLNVTKMKNQTINYINKLDSINQQLDKIRELETSSFHVYGIRHKFNDDFSIKKNFSRCWVIPLIPTFCADGKVYNCFDCRGWKNMVLCNHFPDVTEIAKIWNTEQHKKMIREIDINKCPRCTQSTSQEIIENVILKDKMCINFP